MKLCLPYGEEEGMHYILTHRRVHVSYGERWCLHSIFHSGLTLCGIWGMAGYLKQGSFNHRKHLCVREIKPHNLLLKR